MVSIPKYKIIQKLGEGRNSISYLAEHRVLGRQVVLKVSSAAENDSKAGFDHLYLRKARAYASLNHPNIVHVHDIGLTNKSLFFVVTDYLSHGNLHDRIRLQNIRLDQAIQIITDIASALDSAHQKGVTHCDLTPSNIVFSEDESVLLTGFSVVKTKKWNTNSKTSKNHTLFESKEQIKFDVYRLAVIFYEMITGAEILYEGLFNTPPSVQQKYIYLQKTFDKALSSQPEEWFTSADEFVQSIKGAVRGVSSKKESIKDPQKITISGIHGTQVNTSRDISGELFIEPSSYVLGEANQAARMAIFGLATLGGVVLISGLYFNGFFGQQNSMYADVEREPVQTLSETTQSDINIDVHSTTVLATPEELKQELEKLYASLSIYSRAAVSDPSLVSNITHDVSKPLIVLDTDLNQQEKTVQIVNAVEKSSLAAVGTLVLTAVDKQTHKPLQAKFFIIPEKGSMRTSKAGGIVNFKLAPGRYTLLAEYNNQQSDLYGIVITAGGEVSETIVINSKMEQQDTVVAINEIRASLAENLNEMDTSAQEDVADSEEQEAPRILNEVGINQDNKYL